jgi:hypothetical protein
MDLEKFNREGFYISKNLLPLTDTQMLLSEIYQLFHLQLSRFKPNLEKNNPENLYTEMQQLLQLDVESYLGAAKRCAKLVTLQRYLSHPNIIRSLDYLKIQLPTIVTEPVLHISSDKLKIPGGYAGFDTHQDWPSIQGSLDCVVVWAPLVRVNKINFPLQVIPESHKQGMLTGKTTSNLYEVDSSLYDKNNFISIEAQPGDVIFMSSWTLHRTGTENCHGFRVSCSSRYDNSTEPYFIKRNFPCAYKRTVDRELVTQNFPSIEKIRDIYE